MSETNDFEIVKFEKDRELAFQELASKPLLVTGWTTGLRPLFFHVQGIDKSGLHLTVVEGEASEGKAGDAVELIFSLDNGQYHLRTQLVKSSATLWTVDLGGELSRLQRRNNFRTTVPKGDKTVFRLTAMKTKTINRTDLVLADISAGGARIRWPKAGLMAPSDGDALSGQINTPGREIEVFGVIKGVRVDADTGETEVGVEFHNLSGRDEQALLQLCLLIRRTHSPIMR